jgi:hypothetical protein
MLLNFYRIAQSFRTKPVELNEVNAACSPVYMDPDLMNADFSGVYFKVGNLGPCYLFHYAAKAYGYIV